MTENWTRRGVLGAMGCSLAASPLVTPAAFAALPGENRLVVIILRGGMDGLDALRPWGDPDFAAARPGLVPAQAAETRLDDRFGLHPRLAPLIPLWQAGELALVQAVATPYRHKRSHFDGQDILEAGTVDVPPGAGRDGWLNRMLGGLPGADLQTAYAIGTSPMLLGTGRAPISNWSPEVDIVLSEQALSLLRSIYADDPMLHESLGIALDNAASDGDAVVFETVGDEMMQAMQDDMAQAGRRANKAFLRVAEFAARQLSGAARIACFSIGGWDTHARQRNALNRPMTELADTILALKSGLGPAWGKTTVLALTEFGRTVRENGTGGTDHGTGGTMILAGGALRGGRVLGRWPGLDEADLFERRDLMPTDDVRRWAAWAIRESFGLRKSFLEGSVFPGLNMGDDPGLLL